MVGDFQAHEQLPQHNVKYKLRKHQPASAEGEIVQGFWED
jgi:hypothetical protein